ncbi:hypothetical protein [Maribacter sp. HTCC2170]|uniref:hypothetical protein n=1 Tax=Maribacter sp. (strain HTCC2170 / KCCM 42371) TaxID=313603 RepID=UPI00006AFCCC|nr:hypothetical protein [Maribacter sp. HTCC2170]EAR01278.1 hypothetical protein FB2170_11176 [Maribacter sp. HTCC2170]
MKLILRIISWKSGLLLSVVVLLLLIVFSFYGLYTNKFYFFKFDNYIFPLLTFLHFTYLYAIWFKIREQEGPDPQMRNLEFALYIIFFIYIYKFIDTLFILLSYTDFESQVIPATFIPFGIVILFLYFMLLALTLIMFKHRKAIIGTYRFDNVNDQIDTWE